MAPTTAVELMGTGAWALVACLLGSLTVVSVTCLVLARQPNAVALVRAFAEVLRSLRIPPGQHPMRSDAALPLHLAAERYPPQGTGRNQSRFLPYPRGNER